MISGGSLPGGVTVTVTSSVAVLPSGSVAVTVTVCVPGVVNVRVTDWPSAVPSENVQR